jgi:hypothetical protein
MNEFGLFLRDTSNEANQSQANEILGLLKDKLEERARSGKYDYRCDVARDYMPLVMKEVEDWGLGQKIMGWSMINGKYFYSIALWWTEQEKNEKSLGFGNIN